jgi:hypothetical protein
VEALRLRVVTPPFFADDFFLADFCGDSLLELAVEDADDRPLLLEP